MVQAGSVPLLGVVAQPQAAESSSQGRFWSFSLWDCVRVPRAVPE